ncbi:MAG: T9SS type A sorting domain-containing protein [Saprospiraceae bacterium]|nr:T9SS type A sorting domain-containing protein [Saprospiraceae bacterium]
MQKFRVICLFWGLLLFSCPSIQGQTGFFNVKLDQTQNAKVNQILDHSMVFSFDAGEMYGLMASQRSSSDMITLKLNDELNWSFYLEPVEIITEDTKIYTIGDNGRALHRSPVGVKAFKGVFADGRDGMIRLTLHNDFMYAFIQDEGKSYFIEPLKYYDFNAAPGKFVCYKPEDIKANHKSKPCFRPPAAFDEHIKVSEADHSGRTGLCYKAKMAILADYLMYIDPAHSGLDAVIDHVVAVLNNVHANYDYNGTINFDDGINFEISELLISTCASCDPLSTQQNPNLLLSEFSSWVDQSGFYHPFHAAHLWSNRDFIGSSVGLAFQSSNLYCNSKARAVLEDWTATAALLKTMVAHEVGHNFNGVHDGSANFLLSPTVSVTDTWSTASKAAINPQIASQKSCLTACGPPVCNRVENIVISNITTTDFTISWSATAQNLYNIKVREAGSTTFIQDMTINTTSITLSPPGYAICKQYDVFIYNNCGSGTLSAAQRAIIKGPTSQGCADFSTTKSVGWSGSAIAFTDKSINATSWFWNFGNGQTSTLQNPSVTYSNAGNFNVSLTVNGVHTLTKTSAVKILPNLNSPFTLAQGGDFETNPTYFAAEAYEGTTNVWEYGTSTYVLATQGNAWKSMLNANVPKVTSKSALYTPSFNFTGYQNYQLHFDISMINKYRNAPYATQVQYSTNGGSTWQRLGDFPSFYNNGVDIVLDPLGIYKIATQVFTDQTGFTSEFYTEENYLHKSIDVSFLYGTPNVIFRFAFGLSGIFNDGYNEDGVLIDNFRIDATNAVPLPLQVESLQGYNKGSYNLLSWLSYQPQDIHHYEVMRSDDGISFYALDSVYPQNENATDFEYKDLYPMHSVNYYRVNAVNIDGSKSYTNTIVLRNEKEETSVIITPNPVFRSHHLTVTDEHTDNTIKDINLYDHLGRLVKTPIARDGIRHLISTDGMQAGIYYLHIKMANGKTETRRAIVMEKQ